MQPFMEPAAEAATKKPLSQIEHGEARAQLPSEEIGASEEWGVGKGCGEGVWARGVGKGCDIYIYIYIYIYVYICM